MLEQDYPIPMPNYPPKYGYKWVFVRGHNRKNINGETAYTPPNWSQRKKGKSKASAHRAHQIKPNPVPTRLEPDKRYKQYLLQQIHHLLREIEKL